ncbi:hypothetical protein CEXT_433501 [Caerostris extrusa]|uniref:Uncharacterized protein n=1 Tax=Caerostris extrusa TaxID=172846 RepID=A0AAV4MCB6_CAEEX|nr:hypothetical protein CEXT_433501 [Caerostris extrusa]
MKNLVMNLLSDEESCDELAHACFYMKSVHTGTEANFHFLPSTLYEKKRDALPPSRPCLFAKNKKRSDSGITARLAVGRPSGWRDLGGGG